MATIAPKLDLIRTVDALKTNPLTRLPVGRGQHIYAYCNVRTNQVVYSLTQILSPQKPLHQLPEAGNNTKPPKLRKDLWRPLWTLSLPAGFQGEAQGVEAWRRLNALKHMHEIYWTPPQDLSRNRTEEELEEIQERIDDRGGSKKESVYDMLKREKKKIRLKTVMDQKANSIADLAAVLGEHERLSGNEPRWFSYEQTEEMLKLEEEAQRGALAQLEDRVERLKPRIKELVKNMPGELAERSFIRTQRNKRHQLRQELRIAMRRKKNMEHAVLMVNLADPDGTLREDVREPEAKATEEVIEAVEDTAEAMKATKAAEDNAEAKEWRKVHKEELRKTWRNPGVSVLRRLKPIDRAGVPNPRVEIAKKGREILLPPGEDGTQFYQGRADRLHAMISDRKNQLKQMGVSTSRNSKDGTLESLPDSLTPEQRQMSYDFRRDISVWTSLLVAYEATGGTLQVMHPDFGDIIDLGATFPNVESKGRKEEVKQEIKVKHEPVQRIQVLKAERETMEKIWSDAHVKYLRKIKAHRLDSAERGRAVLLPPGEDDTQVHQDRMETLVGMIRAHRDKLKQMGINSGRRNEDGTKNSMPQDATPEQQKMAGDIKVWKELIGAYEITNGTLQVVHPEGGFVVNLGIGRVPQAREDKSERAINNEQEAEPDNVINLDVDRVPHALKDRSEPIAEAEQEAELEDAEPKHPILIPKPVFSMDGVKVSWQNIMDAEFASEWPRPVQHAWMGHTRYVAPKPDAEPRMSAQEYMDGKMRPRPEKEEPAKVRQGVVKSVSAAIIRQLIAKGNQKKQQEKRAAEKVVAEEGAAKEEVKEV